MLATARRLSALDASFLEIESGRAHMHVGWVAAFSPPAEGPRPTFEDLRDHVARRLHRAPRYRQRLAGVPLGLNAPEWVDAADFDVRDHVVHTSLDDLHRAADTALSLPLDRGRPLWELWIADRLADGRIGVIGKAHHCLVDGMAAVELAGLLLDPTPDANIPETDGWAPRSQPGAVGRLATGVRDLVAGQAPLVQGPARAVRRPRQLFRFAQDARRAAGALAGSLEPAPAAPLLNEPISPLRRLALLSRPLDDLRAIGRDSGTTLNDVVLAACAGGVRELMLARDMEPERLKTMVPCNVRGDDAAAELGNRISFIFVDLPCDEPDARARLMRVHASTRGRKAAGAPKGGDSVLRALGLVPRPLQALAAHAAASPRAYNLVISNVPGPSEPLWMGGCRLESAHPVIPLSDRHALSIGLTTIGDGAHFGVYADRLLIPDVERLADGIRHALDELRASVGPGDQRTASGRGSLTAIARASGRSGSARSAPRGPLIAR